MTMTSHSSHATAVTSSTIPVGKHQALISLSAPLIFIAYWKILLAEGSLIGFYMLHHGPAWAFLLTSFWPVFWFS